MIRFTIILLFLILLNPLLLFAQDEAAPLILKMKNAKSIEKIDLMNKISVVYRKTDRYKAMDYARQAFALSVNNNYLPGKALAKKNEGICWFFIGNNDSAMLCYKQALDIFTRVNDNKGMSACYNNLGLISQETGKYDEALKFYQLSIDIDQKLGDELGVTATKNNLVAIYVYQGKTMEALKLANEIIIIGRLHSDEENIMMTLVNRAAIYDNLNQSNKAIIDINDAISIARRKKDGYVEALALSNLGLYTWHVGYPNEALKILNQVLEIAEDSNEGFDILNSLWIMAEIYSSIKKYTKSNEILLKVLKENEKMDNKRRGAKALTTLGRNLMELNEMDKAVGYLTKSLEVTVEINAKYEMLENYRNLAHANAILHNFKTADSLQDLFAVTYSQLFDNDSIANSKQEKTKIVESKLSSSSTITDWIIAFSIFAILTLFSVIAFRKSKT